MSMSVGKPVNNDSNSQQINPSKDLPQPTTPHQTVGTQQVAHNIGILSGSPSQIAGQIDSSKLPTNQQSLTQKEGFATLAKNAIKNVASNLLIGLQNIAGTVRAKIRNIGLNPQQKAKICNEECTKVIRKLVEIKIAIKEMKSEDGKIPESQWKDWNREIRKLTPHLNNAKNLLKDLANEIKPEHDSNLRHSLELAKDIVVTYRFLKNENSELFKHTKETINGFKKVVPENNSFSSEATIQASADGKQHKIKTETNFNERVENAKVVKAQGYSNRAADDDNTAKKQTEAHYESLDETPDYFIGAAATFNGLVDKEDVSFNQVSSATKNLILEKSRLFEKTDPFSEYGEGFMPNTFNELIQEQIELKENGEKSVETLDELKELFMKRIMEKNIKEETIDLETFIYLVKPGPQPIPRSVVNAKEFNDYKKLFEFHRKQKLLNDPDFKRLLAQYENSKRDILRDPSFEHLTKKYSGSEIRSDSLFRALLKNNANPNEFEELRKQYEKLAWQPSDEHIIHLQEISDTYLPTVEKVINSMFDDPAFQIVISDMLDIELDTPFTHPDDLARTETTSLIDDSEVRKAFEDFENLFKDWKPS